MKPPTTLESPLPERVGKGGGLNMRCRPCCASASAGTCSADLRSNFTRISNLLAVLALAPLMLVAMHCCGPCCVLLRYRPWLACFCVLRSYCLCAFARVVSPLPAVAASAPAVAVEAAVGVGLLAALPGKLLNGLAALLLRARVLPCFGCRCQGVCSERLRPCL
eukprot:11746347-Alexandrium_andersonii.AAC.1